MTCRCAERRAAITSAIKKPSTVLTAAGFVAKTGVQDIRSFASERTAQVMRKLGKGSR